MPVVRRSFRDDFNETLSRLVESGVITGYASDIDGYGPILGLNLVVTVPAPIGPAASDRSAPSFTVVDRRCSMPRWVMTSRIVSEPSKPAWKPNDREPIVKKVGSDQLPSGLRATIDTDRITDALKELGTLDDDVIREIQDALSSIMDVIYGGDLGPVPVAGKQAYGRPAPAPRVDVAEQPGRCPGWTLR